MLPFCLFAFSFTSADICVQFPVLLSILPSLALSEWLWRQYRHLSWLAHSGTCTSISGWLVHLRRTRLQSPSDVKVPSDPDPPLAVLCLAALTLFELFSLFWYHNMFVCVFHIKKLLPAWNVTLRQFAGSYLYFSLTFVVSSSDSLSPCKLFYSLAHFVSLLGSEQIYCLNSSACILAIDGHISLEADNVSLAVEKCLLECSIQCLLAWLPLSSSLGWSTTCAHALGKFLANIITSLFLLVSLLHSFYLHILLSPLMTLLTVYCMILPLYVIPVGWLVHVDDISAFFLISTRSTLCSLSIWIADHFLLLAWKLTVVKMCKSCCRSTCITLGRCMWCVLECTFCIMKRCSSLPWQTFLVSAAWNQK